MDSAIMRLRDLNGNGTIDNEAELRPVVTNIASSGGFDSETGEYFSVGAAAVTWSASGAAYLVTNTFPDDLSLGSYGAVWSSAATNTSSNPYRDAHPYANLAQYEATVNPDGMEINPNPFALVVDADGNVYVNDAGANVTLKVTPDGTITTFALYPTIPVPPEIFGVPFDTQPVPTGIAIGPDGAIYTSQLTGGPFLPGAASVFRLQDLNNDGDALDDGEMTVVATDLTTVTSIAFGSDGSLYATEFRGFLTAGEGDEAGPPPSDGDVVRWTGSEWEPIVTGLMMPTSVVAAPNGDLFVLTIDGTIFKASIAR
jgi:hypothetical protein